MKRAAQAQLTVVCFGCFALSNCQKDVALLDSCVGVGELAVADHRGSNPTAAELARIARRARMLHTAKVLHAI